jgi:hypothetical protein
MAPPVEDAPWRPQAGDLGSNGVGETGPLKGLGEQPVQEWPNSDWGRLREEAAIHSLMEGKETVVVVVAVIGRSTLKEQKLP